MHLMKPPIVNIGVIQQRDLLEDIQPLLSDILAGFPRTDIPRPQQVLVP
jgi:hypothetical protein